MQSPAFTINYMHRRPYHSDTVGGTDRLVKGDRNFFPMGNGLLKRYNELKVHLPASNKSFNHLKCEASACWDERGLSGTTLFLQNSSVTDN